MTHLIGLKLSIQFSVFEFQLTQLDRDILHLGIQLLVKLIKTADVRLEGISLVLQRGILILQ
jgi:hypothetical protein